MQYPTALAADLLIKRGWMLVTAESCTGGLMAAACTELAGSSQWFERGFVTYSNAAKTDLLDVDPILLAEFGAVSEPVAAAMATGALVHSLAQVAIAVTGIAGPSGATPGKAVGTVCFGFAWGSQHMSTEMRHFAGDRTQVRQAAVRHGLGRLLEILG